MSTRPFGAERPRHRADVDRDVLNHEAAPPPRIADGIELSGRDADTWLEESVPDALELQRQPKQLGSVERKNAVADGQADGTDKDRAEATEPAIRNESSGDARKIGQRQKAAEQQQGRVLGPASLSAACVRGLRQLRRCASPHRKYAAAGDLRQCQASLTRACEFLP